MNWLYSVIEHREELMEICQKGCMEAAVERMLKNGITTFGAISSHGLDLEVCADAKQNVVFFNELIGSQASMADVLFGDFMERFRVSKEVKRGGFIPAMAIHSPYSVHPVLIKKALEVAKNESLLVTAHFMESFAEKEWLEDAKGGFAEFFEKLLNQSKPVNDPSSFLELFKDTKTLFTHAIYGDEKSYDTIAKNKHAIIHCPVSNRLLGNGVLDIAMLDNKKIPWVVATDGLSSNYDLDLWEEMKIALFIHTKIPLNKLAKRLLDGVTVNAAKALGLPKGEIREGFDADILVLNIENSLPDDLELHMILHRYEIKKIFIGGDEV
jgi:cytosine/adenosine deaminase-related metal-dependent hydrolase